MTEPASVPDWFDGTPLDKPGPGRVLFTTRRYPLFYLQITKCGCTFLRNLLYYLDHDRLHDASNRIHAHEADFLKADLIPRADLRRSPYLFAVVRDPVDRFLSLYFDKLSDVENQYDIKMRTRVAKAAGLKLATDLTLEDHRQNCLKTLEWFGRNLDGSTEGKPNPHWQRQSVRLSHTAGLVPRLLTLDGLSGQLETVLGPLIPDLGAKIASVRVRNQSRKPFTKAEIMTPGIAAAVARVYPADSKTYAQVRAEWNK